MTTSRRNLLKLAAGAAGLSALPLSLQKALAIEPRRVSGTIKDVEHVVILMQENRAFDHYFGTLRGVRGYDDPRAITLPGGKPVWYQPKTPGDVETVTPFHLDTKSTSAQTMHSLDHFWKKSFQLWKTPRCLDRGEERDDDGLFHPQPTSRSITRWPTPSRSATPITARSSGPPIPTGCSCSPAPAGFRPASPITMPWSTIRRTKPIETADLANDFQDLQSLWLDHLCRASAEGRHRLARLSGIRQLRRQRAGLFRGSSRRGCRSGTDGARARLRGRIECGKRQELARRTSRRRLCRRREE